VGAALLAFRNPLSSGVILADEVGLGKPLRQGLLSPKNVPKGVVICSYQFAKAKADDIQIILQWDLAVIDEAHRVRNVYKKGNKTAGVSPLGCDSALVSKGGRIHLLHRKDIEFVNNMAADQLPARPYFYRLKLYPR